ncbi:hypothetical protein GLAREA_13052 [Glarea lozoyensis ATCC 20868]|uniref:Uncharacterized protein n=1 Tax=Glarea lozoyensis (strain ATCC 20868 / MF5171) TaxID=1116229 RepID=S3CZL8_GLAL2|nr:uncharacterized protein GLAREA_13052 [Glarea lozoyensis ATCC 20868]EPE30329.1 hypothetical protein GLAREA_13052 [Glarea lozoyensis ATCC 20868]
MATPFPASSKDSRQDVLDGDHKHTLIDRFWGIFSVGLPTKKRSLQIQEEPNGDSSPWTIPVYVLSTRQDKDKHQIAVQAKCTIDTGNMQGNIVSRKFIEMLGYPESAIAPLTKEEEAGATSVTGHRLIPQGAINLTWYHKKSTRVFRDTRFLISPNEHYDLIIGAWSIQKDRILDVPNLMLDIITFTRLIDLDLDSAHEDVRNRRYKVKDQVAQLRNDINNARKLGEEGSIPKYEQEQKDLNKEYAIWTNPGWSDDEKLGHVKTLKADLKAKLVLSEQNREVETEDAPPPYNDKQSLDKKTSK